ncbi:response regulator [Neorhizobium lilium]|uniref:Response regulator n=1 Tax=Neorhizobium lilium TaxID=2503024 RepID=A0A3S3RLZ9_9HYPH|nr:response regulator [Neorhizobium lilium]RWX81773.1 response regulator [Neorhizobium lilium]
MPIRKLIGIVDDDPDIPAALSSLLRSFGYRAECFVSASDLLQRQDLASFACVISDIHMPVINGLELTRRLRDIQPHLPVILMTGRPEADLEDQARACGAISCVAKPISVNTLLENLEEAFGRTK